jgi:hypothetical protein
MTAPQRKSMGGGPPTLYMWALGPLDVQIRQLWDTRITVVPTTGSDPV